MNQYQLRRNYRTHTSFVPQVITYIENQPENLEKIVSFMALKYVLQKVYPNAINDWDNHVYVQEKISGIRDVDGLYAYFNKKGLSQSEVSHRLKRVKFLRMIGGNIYIIPPIEVIDWQDSENEIIIENEPVVREKQMAVERNVNQSYITSSIGEFTKVLNHSGFSYQLVNEMRVFSGKDYRLSLSPTNLKLDIEKINGETVDKLPYKKSEKHGYNHIIYHSFAEFSHLMKEVGFNYMRKESGKLIKIFNRDDCVLTLQWQGEQTDIKIELKNFK